MKRLTVVALLLAILASILPTDTAEAQRRGRRSGGGGTVSVRGYTRRDGTYVRPHTRRAPGSGGGYSSGGGSSYAAPADAGSSEVAGSTYTPPAETATADSSTFDSFESATVTTRTRRQSADGLPDTGGTPELMLLCGSLMAGAAWWGRRRLLA